MVYKMGRKGTIENSVERVELKVSRKVPRNPQ